MNSLQSVSIIAAQVRRSLHPGDGYHGGLHPGVLQLAQERGQLLLHFFVDSSNSIRSHREPPFWRCIAKRREKKERKEAEAMGLTYEQYLEAKRLGEERVERDAASRGSADVDGSSDLDHSDVEKDSE